MPALPCTRCGQPITLTDTLADSIGDLPAGAPPLSILCDDCAADSQPKVRVYKVALTFSELAGVETVEGGEDDGGERELWEEIGGFSIRGQGDSVRDFVDRQSKEWARRMELIVSMADAPPNEEWPPTLETKDGEQKEDTP